MAVNPEYKDAVDKLFILREQFRQTEDPYVKASLKFQIRKLEKVIKGLK